MINPKERELLQKISKVIDELRKTAHKNADINHFAMLTTLGISHILHKSNCEVIKAVKRNPALAAGMHLADESQCIRDDSGKVIAVFNIENTELGMWLCPECRQSAEIYRTENDIVKNCYCE